MKSNLASTEHNLNKIDKEIEQENKEIRRLEEGNGKLKEEIAKNEEAGNKILAEMGAI